MESEADSKKTTASLDENDPIWVCHGLFWVKINLTLSRCSFGIGTMLMQSATFKKASPNSSMVIRLPFQQWDPMKRIRYFKESDYSISNLLAGQLEWMESMR